MSTLRATTEKRLAALGAHGATFPFPRARHLNAHQRRQTKRAAKIITAEIMNPAGMLASRLDLNTMSLRGWKPFEGTTEEDPGWKSGQPISLPTPTR